VNGKKFSGSQIETPLAPNGGVDVSGYTSTTRLVTLAKSDILTGVNKISFQFADGVAMRVHLEIVYPCVAGKTRKYTPPGIFFVFDTFSSIATS
jgi:hypothetical protein